MVIMAEMGTNSAGCARAIVSVLLSAWRVKQLAPIEEHGGNDTLLTSGNFASVLINVLIIFEMSCIIHNVPKGFVRKNFIRRKNYGW